MIMQCFLYSFIHSFQEFTCGSCGSGFVEEITEEAEPAADDDDDYWDDDDFGMADDQAHQVLVLTLMSVLSDNCVKLKSKK